MVDQETMNGSGMQLDAPAAAAAAALGELPPDELAGEPAESSPAPPRVDEHALRLELRGLIATVDWLATSALGPKMKLAPADVTALEEAWLPYAIETGGVNLPTWVGGLVVTAGVYGPRVREALAERKAKGEQGEASNRAAA